MTFNPKDYLPKPKDWFETEISYIGMGHAEFENPSGWVEGTTTIHYDAGGNPTVEMQIEKLYCEKAEAEGLDRHDTFAWLISGIKPQNGLSVRTVTPHTKCRQLSVTMSEGRFNVIGDISHNHWAVSTSEKLTFYIGKAVWRRNTNSEPYYWVLPLVNMVYEPNFYPYLHPEITQHPLSFWDIPEIPKNLSNEEAQSAIVHALYRNFLEVFLFNERPAFIEPLLNFHEGRDKLKASESDYEVTAIMVGEVGSFEVEWDELPDWLPLDFLHPLSLATGSLVGISWIEVRDKSGDLMGRFHSKEWQAPYQQGTTILDNFSRGGIGWLLHNAPVKLSANERVAVRDCVKAGQKHYYLEDKLSFIFRALDSLSKSFRKKIPLNKQTQEQIKTARIQVEWSTPSLME